MTVPPAHPAAPAPVSALESRRAHRNSVDPLVGGVASGLAAHLGLSVFWVRAFFFASSALSGLGIVLYGALWMFLPSDAGFESSTPGLESASRTGKRPGRQRRFTDLGGAIALGALGLGLVFTLEAALGRGAVLVPVLLACAGMALLWRQADEAQRERWFDPSGRLDLFRTVFGSGSAASYVRVATGVLLVVLAGLLFTLGQGGPSIGREAWVAGLLGIAGVAVAVGPWVFRLASDLGAERAERIRTQERADMAAHLHDSVLQTLALIQRNAHDPAAVARLARSQERDLRAWLYTGEQADAATLAGALRELAARVEDEHGVVVDVVTVGDSEEVGRLRPLVQAAGEAVVNAAKHASAHRVDVFAECTPEAVEVFVRDRGVGFDPEAVPEDRLGVRGSIVDRMTRHGGTATVRSAPGEGTEVRLSMPMERE